MKCSFKHCIWYLLWLFLSNIIISLIIWKMKVWQICKKIRKKIRKGQIPCWNSLQKTCANIKGTVHPKSYIFSSSAIYPFRLFQCKLSSFKNTSFRTICLHLNWMEMQVIKQFLKTLQQRPFLEIMTCIAHNVYKPCCQQFHVRPVLSNQKERGCR